MAASFLPRHYPERLWGGKAPVRFHHSGRVKTGLADLNCGGLLSTEKVMGSLQLICEEVAPCFR